MSQSNGLFNLAAAASLINAILHITGAAFAGFASAVMPIVFGGVLWLLCAVGLKAHKRLIAYLAFLLAVIGGLFVYSQFGPDSSLASWANIGITLLDLCIALVLFVVIWRRPAMVLRQDT